METYVKRLQSLTAIIILQHKFIRNSELNADHYSSPSVPIEQSIRFIISYFAKKFAT